MWRIDYALPMIFRFREELRHGADVESAVVTTMQHAGRSVIVSGTTVAVGLVSLVILPLPFIRSIGIGGMLIPAVSVLAAITLLPAMLFTLGTRINKVRVMPKRLVEGSEREAGFWSWWACVETGHPVVVAAVGIAIVAALLVPGLQLNPSEAQAKDRRGRWPASSNRSSILVQGDAARARLDAIAAHVRATEGVDGAAVGARSGGNALVEAIPSADGAAPETKRMIERLQHDVLPALQQETGLKLGLGGVAPEDRDFVKAVYGNFPYVLLFVVILTYLSDCSSAASR